MQYDVKKARFDQIVKANDCSITFNHALDAQCKAHYLRVKHNETGVYAYLDVRSNQADGTKYIKEGEHCAWIGLGNHTRKYEDAFRQFMRDSLFVEQEGEEQ